MKRTATLVAAALIAAALGAPASADPEDAAAAAPKVQLCHGKLATIVGTRHDDRLVGTNARDVIVGLGGNDRILGKGGDDWICGKAGYDRLYPGGGADHVEGGQGGDTVHYSAGDDVIDGGLGQTDFVDYGNARSPVSIDVPSRVAAVGGSERDRFQGFEYYELTRYADRFDAGGANASVYAGRRDDILHGGAGNDYLDGGPGNDRIDGGRGIDNLKGSGGGDRLTDLHGPGYIWDGVAKRYDKGGIIRTGLSADHYILYPGSYEIDSGAGDDEFMLRGKVSYTDILTGAGDDEVSFLRPSATGGQLRIRMQSGDDDVFCPAIGCGRATDLFGGAGVNSLELPADTPAVTVFLGPAGSVVFPSDPESKIFIDDFAHITTGGGADIVTGTDVATTIVTGVGDDTVNALGGDDVVSAGNGDDTADGGDGDDQCYSVEHPTNCETVG
jgi:Ca2+-binding RTX toxin-like protein